MKIIRVEGESYAGPMFAGFLIMGMLIYSFVTIVEKDISNENELIETHLTEVIEEVEENGYVTDKVKYTTEEFINDKTRYVNVTMKGTEEKVEKGSEVIFMIEMNKEGLFGNKIAERKIVKEGIAK